MSAPGWEGAGRRHVASAGRRLGTFGAVLLAGFVLVAVAAPLLAPYDPTARVTVPFSAPSWQHPLGSDDVGHDLLSALIFGTRVTLVVGFVAAAVSTLVGTALGLVAGYLRGWVDTAIMRTVDVVLSLPFLPLMIVIGVFLGPGIRTEILVISTVMWAGAARELRAQVLSVREREHVLSARAMGAGPARILRRHVGPQVVPLVVPQFVLAAKRAILFEAALSFLGLGAAGVQSWGTMLFNAHARSAFLTNAWLWWVVPPGAAIALAVLAFAFIGYGLEERARPRLRGRVRSVRRPATTSPDSTPADSEDALLDVDALTVVYDVDGESLVAVEGVSLHVARSETVGLVGESGAGKSTLALAAAGLLHAPARVRAGSVQLAGRDLLGSSPDERRRLRGDRVAFVPQDAMNALNPVFRVGGQIAEAITVHHRDVSRGELQRRVRSLLAEVGVDPAHARSYPHELSGGMRQRAVIAMALANDPDLLIADEPTSGVDVVVQAELIALLERLRTRFGLALLVVSHDLPLVARLAERVVVLRHGRVVEQGPVEETTRAPKQAYTRELLEAVPRLRTGRAVP